MNYFIYFSTEDGIGMDGPLDEEEVSRRLAHRYYGENVKIQKDVEDVSQESAGLVILRGEVVFPKPVEVVTKYKF